MFPPERDEDGPALELRKEKSKFAIQPPGRVSRQVAPSLMRRSSRVGQDTGIPVGLRQS